MTPADPYGRIFTGDARAVLLSLPAESYQAIITSPPYWQARDYGAPGQIGLETTVDTYVTTLAMVLESCRRVLRKDGVLWLNLGDRRARNGGRGAGVGKTSKVGRKNTGLSAHRKYCGDRAA